MFRFVLIVLQSLLAPLACAVVAEAQTDEQIDAYVALADSGFELSLAVNSHHRDEPELRIRVLNAAIESARFQSAELGSLLSARASAHAQLESFSEAADDLAASIPLWEESSIYRNPMEPTLIRHLVRAERYLEAALWTDRFRGELNRPLSRGAPRILAGHGLCRFGAITRWLEPLERLARCEFGKPFLLLGFPVADQGRAGTASGRGGARGVDRRY